MARRKFYEGEKVILGAWVELGRGEVLDVSGTDEFMVRVTEGIFSGSPVFNALIWCKAESLRKDLEKKNRGRPPKSGSKKAGGLSISEVVADRSFRKEEGLEKKKKKKGRPRKDILKEDRGGKS